MPRACRLSFAAWPAAAVVCLGIATLPAAAYVPGSGTLFSENFNGTLDEDWEQGNGVPPNPSPWEQVLDGADNAFYADGYGPIGSSPTAHWARHFVHPVYAETFSIALEIETERGTGYTFDLEIEQRAETKRKLMMRVDGDGAVSLWRMEGGVYNLMAATGSNTIPKNKKRWIRFGLEPDGSGHRWVRFRVWNGGANGEPSTWDLEFLDDLDTVERVHRFEFTADGPRGVITLLDDLDVFGDGAVGVASSITTIYLMELSHLDIGFTEPPDEIEAFAKTHLDTVLNNLEADPDYRWMIESGWWLDRWWERSSQAQRDRMIGHLQGGRLSLSASYAQLHTTAVGHEQLTRAVYWSNKLARENGFQARTWITDDVPGSTFALPELLSRAGIEFFIGGMNTTFGGGLTEPDHGERPFWWVGPDGSRILAWHTFNSYAEAFQYGFSFFDNLSDLYRKLGQKLPEQEEAGYDYPEMLLMRGFDNHYQGFHARNLVNQWNATYDTPVFILATPEEFFDHMLAIHGPESFPSYSGDYGCAWSGRRGGAQHTQTWVREAHRDARAAEAFLAAGSSVDGNPVPQSDVDFMYRRMLESDEHTGAGGWPEYFTPEEMDRNNRIHLGYAEDARDTAASLLEEGLDRSLAELSASGDAVVAVNPLGRERNGWVRIALPVALYDTTFRVIDRQTAAEVPFQRFPATYEILFRGEDIPSMGYKVFDLVPGEPTAVPSGMLEVTSNTLENDYYYVEVNATDGSVESLYDKMRGRELIDFGSSYKFNELASNTKQQYDYQNPPVAEPPASASVSIEWSGPMVVSLKVTRTGTPHTETVYRLYRNEDRVEFENVFDRDLMPYVPQSIAARAYTVTLPFDIHDFQIRTESTTRFLDPVGDSFLRENLFDWHNVEHALALYDDSGGIFYAVDSVCAHHLENFSSLTSASYSTGDGLVLSFMKSKVDEYTYEGGTVGPVVIEPDTPPIHRYTHHVRGTPASFDPVEASRFGFEALEPVRARLLSHRSGNLPVNAASYFSQDAPGVLLYTAKTADDGDGVILRMNELEGAPAVARVSSDVFTFSDPAWVEQDEEGLGDPLSMDGDGFLVALEPYETATVRVRAAPAWSPITLSVNKNTGAGAVRVRWTEGVTPYSLDRADDARFTTGQVTLVDEMDVTTHDDPVLHDGNTYFYLAR